MNCIVSTLVNKGLNKMKFHELTEDTKIKAIEKFRSTNYFQPDFSLCREELEEQGFESPEYSFNFSGDLI